MNESTLYDQLIACNKALFDHGHYEASYHLLCAAKHYASDIGDISSLHAILELAQQQSNWINVHAPNNVLSQQSSLSRSRKNLYTSLFEQIRGHIQIAESNRIMDNLRQQL